LPQRNIDLGQIAENEKSSPELLEIKVVQLRKHHGTPPPQKSLSAQGGHCGGGRDMMRKLTIFAALAATTAFASPALAANDDGNRADGHWQVKLLGTGVLVDGKITKVEKDLIGLPAGSQTDINNNVVPTVAVEYFFSPNISAETICCLTQHHASGAGALAGKAIVDHVMILPATLTLKYHLDTGSGIKPYIGVGPSVFFFIDEKPGAGTRALGAATAHLDNQLGVALQAGIDIAVNDSGMGISLDAKKYFMNTKAHFYTAGGVEALTTVHRLDPWVLSAGVSFRF